MIMRYSHIALVALSAAVLSLTSCREDPQLLPPEQVETHDTTLTDIAGFYLLNEGNMGSNKATLDYYDCARGLYTRDLYAWRNPDVPKELGDVGNDLAIYGSRLYAVINVSGKVEVMDARTARRIGQLDVPNCRNLCFSGAYGYVTSYAGPVSLDASHAQIGYVARFDTATLRVIDTCHVGYQPDGLAIWGDTLYVANSGGYMAPDYDSTVSVIPLDRFREQRRIPVAVNLQHLLADARGTLWVSSRGDYYDRPARLFCIDPLVGRVTDTLDLPVSGLWLSGDSLWYHSTQFSYVTMTEQVACGVIDVRTRRATPLSLTGADGRPVSLQRPYGLAVHPVTRDIYLTDARSYASPGILYCFRPDGTLRWSVRTGDIPAHFAFLRR